MRVRTEIQRTIAVSNEPGSEHRHEPVERVAACHAQGRLGARAGELDIIPGSMGKRSYIGRGRGGAESFHGCRRGAGRIVSRTEARRRITLEDHGEATARAEERSRTEPARTRYGGALRRSLIAQSCGATPR
ncbi:MAG: RtcB family protein [Xanthomonadales bacterium]|nr:RtcB family protein [Xanthomonadales bacterium]